MIKSKVTVYNRSISPSKLPIGYSFGHLTYDRGISCISSFVRQQDQGSIFHFFQSPVVNIQTFPRPIPRGRDKRPSKHQGKKYPGWRMPPNTSRPSVVGADSGPQPPFPLRLNGNVIEGFGRGSKEVSQSVSQLNTALTFPSHIFLPPFSVDTHIRGPSRSSCT